jgi:hypothetical protein
VFLLFYCFMRRLFILFTVVFSVLIWFSSAINTILNYSYTTDDNNVNIYRTDNSNWWNVDINVRNSDVNDWLLLGTVKISDQSFMYTKLWNWEQRIKLVPDDWWEEIQFTIPERWVAKSHVSRTVITAVPKTWPSFNLIWIILASLAIFGGYIYIKKRADI